MIGILVPLGVVMYLVRRFFLAGLAPSIGVSVAREALSPDGVPPDRGVGAGASTGGVPLDGV
jgi:hypothetical protein